MMMQQNATLFAQEWETPGLPKADNGNKGHATKFNHSVAGTTKVYPMKETTVPKKREAKEWSQNEVK